MFAKLSLLSLLFSSAALGASNQTLSYGNIDKSATPGARALLKYIQLQYGSHYISGQQDIDSWNWVEKNIGVAPAILGSDFTYYSPSAVAHGGKSHAVEDVIQHAGRNGINALVWHWYAPTCLLDTDKEPWYKGFYTEATCFNVSEAVNDHGNGTNYKLLLRDIDAIAAQIKRLDQANVPILFRPLHEPEGGWFWWGAQGPAPFKKLWDILYDRITRYHNLHNLVWVCNTADPAWYPGNDKCDIATIDHYPAVGDHGVAADQYKKLQTLTKNERVLAMAEVGPIPDPDMQARENVNWAYWMVWSGEFIEDGKQNPNQFLHKVYNDTRVVALNWEGA
ncbi:mannan endo-1,4-beta-mannosidase man26A [Aspergillus tubingensis]|uniref:Mannan endo-1,4-beta-mannosidase A n=2 Tax=Aspergillus subgen. Circumdati TaxID=2720871 RepID=A0A117DYX8_ASPNG|nr:mannan endo-1,4-beta-mannosidase A precursor [Aspergillus niger]GLA64460.1 mannan endo-1,4-beta-mannosidase man26A [Aspergillus tubingensis]GLA76626.1 mannan endo-1,4-beta-mannosidase man26A [Aspergillus tubingensis]GLA86146.1 mannan endo-1,4-beta-mannosidase man26A [Aspergillus tubingensis]GLA95036.1 mannan endo-1,4-beta-mannosidase man26A [Aspergillus tubingensis]